jgi:hypothetical protein
MGSVNDVLDLHAGDKIEIMDGVMTGHYAYVVRHYVADVYEVQCIEQNWLFNHRTSRWTAASRINNMLVKRDCVALKFGVVHDSDIIRNFKTYLHKKKN